MINKELAKKWKQYKKHCNDEYLKVIRSAEYIENSEKLSKIGFDTDGLNACWLLCLKNKILLSKVPEVSMEGFLDWLSEEEVL